MRCRWVMCCAAALVCFVAVATGGEKYTADVDKSSIEWVGSKPDGKHQGGFKKFTATADVNHEQPDSSSLQITIETSSLFADDDRLAAHLKSPDFFNIRKYPKMTFQSTAIEHRDDGGIVIKGKLTMLGKTESIEIPVKAKLEDELMELTADFSIDRTAFGMTYGIGKVDNEVKITAKLVMKRS